MEASIFRTVIASAVLALASSALAVQGAERLLLDLVRIKDGRYFYDQLSICHLKLPTGPSKKFQIRSRAEAPSQSVVSRDSFVALVTQVEQSLALGMAEQAIGLQTASQALNALDCDPLEAPIGAVDLEVTTTMTLDGMQVEVTSTITGQVSRSTKTWKEMYE